MLDVKTSSFRFIIFTCEKNLFWFTSVEVFVEFLRYVRVRYQHAEFAGYVNSQFWFRFYPQPTSNIYNNIYTPYLSSFNPVAVKIMLAMRFLPQIWKFAYKAQEVTCQSYAATERFSTEVRVEVFFSFYVPTLFLLRMQRQHFFCTLAMIFSLFSAS